MRGWWGKKKKGKDNKVLPSKWTTWRFRFLCGKIDRQVWTEAGWRRGWFHTKQWHECLGEPIEATYMNVNMAGEVYSSLHDTAVMKQVSLNPNFSLSTCYLTGVGWRSVEAHRDACKNSRDCQLKSSPDSLVQPSQQREENCNFSLVHSESVISRWHCQCCTNVFIVAVDELFSGDLSLHCRNLVFCPHWALKWSE